MPFFVIEGPQSRVIVEADTADDARGSAERRQGKTSRRIGIVVTQVTPSSTAANNAVFIDDATRANFFQEANRLATTQGPISVPLIGATGRAPIPPQLSNSINQNVSTIVASGVPVESLGDLIAQIFDESIPSSAWQIPPDLIRLARDAQGRLVLNEFGAPQLDPVANAVINLMSDAQAIRGEQFAAQLQWGQLLTPEQQLALAEIQNAPEFTNEQLIAQIDASSAGQVRVEDARGAAGATIARITGQTEENVATITGGTAENIVAAEVAGRTEVAGTQAGADVTVAELETTATTDVAGIQREQAFGVQDRINAGDISIQELLGEQRVAELGIEGVNALDQLIQSGLNATNLQTTTGVTDVNAINAQRAADVQLLRLSQLNALNPEQQLLQSAIAASPQVLRNLTDILGSPTRLGTITSAGGVGSIGRLINSFGPFGTLDRGVPAATNPITASLPRIPAIVGAGPPTLAGFPQLPAATQPDTILTPRPQQRFPEELVEGRDF